MGFHNNVPINKLFVEVNKQSSPSNLPLLQRTTVCFVILDLHLLVPSRLTNLTLLFIYNVHASYFMMVDYSKSQYYSPQSKDKANLYNSFSELHIQSPDMTDSLSHSHQLPSIPGSPEHNYSYLAYDPAELPRHDSNSTLAYSPSLSSRSASPSKPHLLAADDDANILRKSTTAHWRNLADASDSPNDLHLPGVTEDAEEIHGMHGRLRLQKTEDAQTHVANRNWMDKQRKCLQAYEYLCHIGEAKQWIEQCIEEEIPSIVKLEEALRDGVILAKLTQAFAPQLVRRIFVHPKLQYRHTDNINFFFQFVEEIGMPDVSYPTLDPPADTNNIALYFRAYRPLRQKKYTQSHLLRPCSWIYPIWYGTGASYRQSSWKT